MAAQKTNLTASDLPDSLSRLRLAIERAVPVGRAHHPHPVWEEESTLRATGAQDQAVWASPWISRTPGTPPR